MLILERVRAACVAASLSLGAGHALALDLSFETIFESVKACTLDVDRYRAVWAKQDAILLSLPVGGALKNIVVSQFFMAPGRNGSSGDYGVVLNAPLAQVAAALPELLGAIAVNGRQRRLVSLASETGDPKFRSQSLLVCRGGTDI